MSYLAIMGYLLLILFVIILMRGKFSPVTLFILLPAAIGLIAGFDLQTLNDYIKAGIGSTTTNAVMFCFAVLFFNIMNAAGLFDPIDVYKRPILNLTGTIAEGKAADLILLGANPLDGLTAYRDRLEGVWADGRFLN